jgi:hypothetical protein
MQLGRVLGHGDGVIRTGPAQPGTDAECGAAGRFLGSEKYDLNPSIRVAGGDEIEGADNALPQCACRTSTGAVVARATQRCLLWLVLDHISHDFSQQSALTLLDLSTVANPPSGSAILVRLASLKPRSTKNRRASSHAEDLFNAGSKVESAAPATHHDPKRPPSRAGRPIAVHHIRSLAHLT